MANGKNKPYPSDIKKIFWLAFTNGLLFFLPILALYYEENLFTLTNVTLVLGIGAITLSIMEVPSGAIADLFGRKKTLILSKIIILISLVVLFIGGSFFMILLHALLRSIGRSLESGTDTSMMYDILYEEKQVERFKKVFGTFFSIWAIGASVGSIIGGHLAEISFRVPIAATTIPVIISLVLITTIKEPNYHKAAHKKIFRHIKESFITILQSKQLVILLIGIATVYAFAESLHELNAIFFEFKSIPLFLFGYASAATFGFSAIGHYLGNDISEKFGNKKTLLFACFGSAILVMVATITPFIGAMILYTASSFFFGVRNTVQGDLLNKEITSAQRATITSINNLTRFLGVSIVIVLIGWAGDIFSINTTFQLGALGMIIGGLVFMGLKGEKK